MELTGPAPLVVAAGILRRGGRVLACQRLPGGAFGGKWEFPGGKVQHGESPEEALVRELSEELEVQATLGAEVARVRHRYPGHPPLRLHFFEVARFAGEPRDRGFAAVRWCAPLDLAGLDWLAADQPLVRRIAAAPAGPLPPLQPGPPHAD